MALADKQVGRNKPGYKCAVCAALEDGLSPEDAATLTEWMSNPLISYKSIADALREDEDCPNISYHSLAAHIRGECLGGKRLR